LEYGVPEHIRSACYESFVNSLHGLSGRWASNRVEHSGWSVGGLPIVPHPDLCVPEGARMARRTRRADVT
jgi:hypothetical protein